MIDDILFASYGTPSGSCPNFAINSTCHAPTSAAVVSRLCVGKGACTIPADTATFGPDPCFDTPKRLAVALSGSCATTLYHLDTTVPVGSTASVRVPTLTASPAVATITEGGVTVWAAGAFVPGVPGLTSAAAGADGKSVVFAAGSGSYAFVAAA